MTTDLPSPSFTVPAALRDDVHTLNPAAPAWTFEIPVSVNDTYGDPFIPEQIDNTITKLLQLRAHRAPIAIFTKAGPDPVVLAKLAALPDIERVIVFYSLTALDEGGISFDERVVMIRELRQIFPATLVFTRPIIRGRNDDPVTLRRLVEVAATHTGALVLGGLHNRYKRKNLEVTVEDRLIRYCDAAGVRSFHKTSCAGAYLAGTGCWVHQLGAPRNLDVLPQLSYEFDLAGDRIVLREGTTGDINFLRMLTRAEIYIESLRSNYNLLTIPTNRKLETTSSWFAWSQNIDVCLDCNYCIIKQIEYLKKMKVQIGVHPTRLPEIVSRTGARVDLAQFRRTKLRAGDDPDRHVYDQVRVAKPCFTHRYDQLRPGQRVPTPPVAAASPSSLPAAGPTRLVAGG